LSKNECIERQHLVSIPDSQGQASSNKLVLGLAVYTRGCYSSEFKCVHLPVFVHDCSWWPPGSSLGYRAKAPTSWGPHSGLCCRGKDK